MPLYEFECLNCKLQYDEIAPYDETGMYAQIHCPKCQSKEKTKLMSQTNFKFANPEGTDRWNNSSTGHDYRFKHNVPKVQAERQRAEALSHMGSDPYGSTVEQDLKLDTGIHTPEFRPGLA